ncbi:uncharacterized protein LOC144572763 [Carex rostrata]
MRPASTSEEPVNPGRIEPMRPATPPEEPVDATRNGTMRPASKGSDKEKGKGVEKPVPYIPPVPFPRRLAENKLNAQFAKFTEVIKGLHITIPFTEALTQMPTYAKFLKDILSNKRSLGGHERVKLTEQCSAILNRELPPKLGDPGKFSIPCKIGKATIKRALCDLGASVSLMPRTIFERMGVGELRPTRMTLQLADSSVRVPLGIVEDVPVLVGKFYVPADFVVMEMEEDKEIPIILGRPFLKTTRTLIDVENRTLTLRIGDEKVEFNLNRAMKCPSETETCCWLGVVDQLAKEQSRRQYRPDESHAGRVPQFEGLENRERGSDEADARSSHDPSEPDADRVKVHTEPPTPELKPFPANLRYEFPDPNNSCPMIFNADLDPARILRFLEDLKAQQTVIEDLIKKVISTHPATCKLRTLPANQHTVCTPPKWALRPEPPDPPSINQ